MKKFFFPALCCLMLFASSCTNDEIQIDINNNVNEVNVTVSLSKFFSGYNYNDTKHDVSVTEDFRTFYSEHGKYIHVRTYFYNSQGNLVDSISVFSTTTNPVNEMVKLAEGTYTAVTMLDFSEENDPVYSCWDVYDRQRLSTAYFKPWTRWYKWSIMAYEAKTIHVNEGMTTNMSVTPEPVGALTYLYFQNFQYKNKATYGTVADNGIRSLTLYSQNVAEGYKLDPNASEKYVYKESTKTNSWYYLSSKMEPANFNESWTFFQTNLIDYCYILAPQFNLYFGYTLEGEDSFHGEGNGNYTITNGKTYLAYWDWFQVGNPYFGVADNSHWNSY